MGTIWKLKRIIAKTDLGVSLIHNVSYILISVIHAKYGTSESGFLILTTGRVISLNFCIFLSRDCSSLFDTARVFLRLVEYAWCATRARRQEYVQTDVKTPP